MSLNRISQDAYFPEAGAQWIQLRTLKTGHYIKTTTAVNYLQYVKSLSLFFERFRLNEIHIGNLKTYQEARLAGDYPFIRRRRPQDEPSPCPTKPNHVNQEMCILRAIMRRAGAWTDELEETYEELAEPKSEIPRALTSEEQQCWIDTARKHERFFLVLLYSLVAFDTTMSTDEMRALRLGDVNLLHRTVYVKDGKNRYRNRTIPIDSADCLWALERLLSRAFDLGSRDPQHYLFPFCRGHVHYPEKPMSSSGLKKPWIDAKVAANLPGFRMYDTRHTAITRMAEAGIPIAVIMAKAGHISPRMSEHYTHISQQVQRRWAQFASEMKKFPSPDWTHERSRLA